MSITSEATNSDVMKEKPQKRVTIMDPKSPSSRELYAKLASANGYSIEPEIDLAAFNSAEFTNTFTLLSNSSPSLNQSFPSSPLLKESMFCDKGVKERLVFGIPLLQWLKLSDAEREAHKRNMRKSSCFRTRLCRAFQKGFCPYGQLCNFAHGEEELHNPPPLHPKYKTMLCRNFVHGICPYGDRCQFIHNKTGVSMDSGFAYSQNFSQSLASASNPVHHRAPFAASNRYSFNHSMMAGSTTSYNMPSMNHNNYRSTMETFRMGLQENGSPIDTTPKRGHSSLNSSCNFNRSTRNLHYKPLMKSDEADNLFGLMQKLTLAENEELENHQDFMNSIGGHHLDT